MNEENKNMPDISPEEELEKYKKQAEEYLNGWKRAKADYINLKKETEAQVKEIKGWMSKVYLLPLLEIMDSFDKAFSQVPDTVKNGDWAKGIEAIKKQLNDYLKSRGVEAISSAGEAFDPAKHEAVEAVPAGESGEPGKISEEVRKGYTVDGEILRPAKVKTYK